MKWESPNGRRGRFPLTMFALLSVIACGDGPTDPDPDPDPDPGVHTIEVTSPIDTLLAVGWSTQLQATARDAGGSTVAATYTWSSSAPNIVSVDATGGITTGSAGTAQISATAQGITGNLRIRVIAADVEAATAVLEDPLLDHLAGGLGPARAAVESALNACATALAAGNLVAADGCLEAMRTAAGGATAPDDRVLLAVMLLLSDHAARLLTL